jgi:hypothetical protein
MIRTLFAFACGAACAAAGCSAIADVPPLDDYRQWKRIDTYGDAPGHGDSYRVIYANEVAQQFTGGQYAPGTILVKEVYSNDAGRPGVLGAVEIMRHLGTTTGFDDQAGWLFTEADAPHGAEQEKTTCWRRCHSQAPYAGAWLDYAR